MVFQVLAQQLKGSNARRKEKHNGRNHSRPCPAIREESVGPNTSPKERTDRATATHPTGQRHLCTSVPYHMATGMIPANVSLPLRPKIGWREEPESEHPATAEVRKANQASSHPPLSQY
jgi:hypothetical protein